MQRSALGIAVLAAVLSSLARADDLRDFCADRPGNGTPACTMDPGHFMLEVGLVDWTGNRTDGVRTDETDFGGVLLRYGLGESTEVQIGWTAWGFARSKDQIAGTRIRASGTGDVTVALRQNLMNPDGGDVSLAVMPFVTAPTGGDAIGAGRRSGGLIVPLSVQLPKGFSLAFTGEVDDAPDSGDNSYHAAYQGTLGLGIPLADSFGTSLELTAERDLDPAGHTTTLSTAVSFAWQANDNLQFDIGSNFGLNGQTLDAELYAGVAERF